MKRMQEQLRHKHKNLQCTMYTLTPFIIRSNMVSTIRQLRSTIRISKENSSKWKESVLYGKHSIWPDLGKELKE